MTVNATVYCVYVNQSDELRNKNSKSNPNQVHLLSWLLMMSLLLSPEESEHVPGGAASGVF